MDGGGADAKIERSGVDGSKIDVIRDRSSGREKQNERSRKR